jgi:hypothetical protein
MVERSIASRHPQSAVGTSMVRRGSTVRVRQRLDEIPLGSSGCGVGGGGAGGRMPRMETIGTGAGCSMPIRSPMPTRTEAGLVSSVSVFVALGLPVEAALL